MSLSSILSVVMVVASLALLSKTAVMEAQELAGHDIEMNVCNTKVVLSGSTVYHRTRLISIDVYTSKCRSVPVP